MAVKCAAVRGGVGFWGPGWRGMGETPARWGRHSSGPGRSPGTRDAIPSPVWWVRQPLRSPHGSDAHLSSACAGMPCLLHWHFGERRIHMCSITSNWIVKGFGNYARASGGKVCVCLDFLAMTYKALKSSVDNLIHCLCMVISMSPLPRPRFRAHIALWDAASSPFPRNALWQPL